MNDVMKDITSVALAIVGVAILGVIFVKSQNAPAVISSVTSGFGNVLGVAMGGTSAVPAY